MTQYQRLYLINLFVVLMLFFSHHVFAEEVSDQSLYMSAAEQLVDHWNNRAYDDMYHMLSASRLGYRALKGTKYKDSEKKSYITGLKTGLKTTVKGMIDNVPAGTYVKLLKTTEMENGIKALIRADYGDTGLGYVDFHLKKTIATNIRVVDWFDYSQGQLVSDNLRQLTVNALPSDSFMENVYHLVSGKVLVRQELYKIIKASQTNDFETFAKIYRGLNPEVKRSRELMVLSVKTANLSRDEELYEQVLEDLYQFHGNDSTISFLLIDHLIYKQKYTEALKTLNVFEQMLGVEDAGLMMLKANISTLSGNYNAGVELAEMAVSIEPEFEDAHWALLFALASAGDYAQAVKVADLLESQFDYLLDDEALAENSGYDGLRASSEFKVWRKDQ